MENLTINVPNNLDNLEDFYTEVVRINERLKTIFQETLKKELHNVMQEVSESEFSFLVVESIDDTICVKIKLSRGKTTFNNPVGTTRWFEEIRHFIDGLTSEHNFDFIDMVTTPEIADYIKNTYLNNSNSVVFGYDKKSEKLFII